ncbi:response regulator [Verrucomicrobia bacterium S94]|nr:response regulator [Verrucomicrobia bacterium S94]
MKWVGCWQMRNCMKKVLIIDDDVFLTGLYEKLLRKEGLDVAVANSGSAGIEQIARYLPDLVILDLHMPDMHGSDVLKTVRNDLRLHHIRVIVFATGYIQKLADAVADLGAYKVLSKMKCKPRDLVQEVLQSLNDTTHIPEAPAEQEHFSSLEDGAAKLDDPGIDKLPLWIERLETDSRDEARRVCLIHLYRMIQDNIDFALNFDKMSAEYKLSTTLKKLMQDLFDHPQLVSGSSVKSLEEAIEKLLHLTQKHRETERDLEAELQQLLKKL